MPRGLLEGRRHFAGHHRIACRVEVVVLRAREERCALGGLPAERGQWVDEDEVVAGRGPEGPGSGRLGFHLRAHAGVSADELAIDRLAGGNQDQDTIHAVLAARALDPAEGGARFRHCRLEEIGMAGEPALLAEDDVPAPDVARQLALARDEAEGQAANESREPQLQGLVERGMLREPVPFGAEDSRRAEGPYRLAVEARQGGRIQ